MIYKGPQAFSPSYDLAPPTHLLPSATCLSFLSLPLCRRSSLLTGEGEPGEGMGEESNIRQRESLVLYNHSPLSGVNHVKLYGPEKAFAELI